MNFQRQKRAILTSFIIISFVLISILFLHPYLKGIDGRFEDYTKELFCQEVSSNTITLHYTLKNPSKYRIRNTPLSFGQVSTDTISIGAAAENALSRLHTFDASSLSAKNQLLYSLLEDSFISSCKMAPFALYAEPLSPLTGTQAQLPVLLSEYQFYTPEDVETYLALLKTLPKYYQEILQFEEAKAAAGLFMSDERVLSVIDECKAFVAMGSNHYLFDTFTNRLEDISDELSQTEYDAFISQNKHCIEKYVYPSYERLAQGLHKLMGSCKNQKGLCYFPDGKTYYELLVRQSTGSNRTILELETLTYQQIIKDIEDMQDVLKSITDKAFSSANPTENIFVDSNPTAILSILQNKLSGIFPTPPPVNISVKYVEKSMEDYLSPAFYLIPAIDNAKENVIYINPKHMNEELTLFTTLAHEGYPGHLYQTTYFNSLNPVPIRSLLGCSGYTEGWATYCEMMSYYLAPITKEEATLSQKNSSVMLGLYALADMGIHYEGWSLSETIHFFSDYGIEDNDAISEIYNMILGDPANYLKYYIGYLEFLELKKEAISTWGNDFSQKRFHKEILEAGPVPFWILREHLF